MQAILSSDLFLVTGGLLKEPAASGSLPIRGGAGGEALSKQERRLREQYCLTPDGDPFGTKGRSKFCKDLWR